MAANLAGKRALVVGGTGGIGQGIAQHLAALNASVTIVGRDAVRAEGIVAEMSKNSTGRHAFLRCDATLLREVDACAQQYIRETLGEAPLDILVLSQGMATFAGRTETAEGLDAKLALHYYSRMAFVDRLLPRLRAAPEAKVMSVLSAGVHGVYGHMADDPELRTHYTLKNAADAAGLYNDLQLDGYSRAAGNERIAFIHSAPGFVDTNLERGLPWWVRTLMKPLKFFATSKETCAKRLSKPLLSAPAGFHLVKSSGEAGASHTPAHTDANVASVQRHTQEVLTRILG